MRLRVLGCSGGIGGRHRTTSFLLDNDVLIDAGTGVGDLTLAELSQIDHIFLTHSHLDHVASIPFLVDTVGGMRTRPLTVHATRIHDGSGYAVVDARIVHLGKSVSDARLTMRSVSFPNAALEQHVRREGARLGLLEGAT